MITADTPVEPTDKPLKGWHVLLIMLGFFGVMFVVNGVFLYHAITSFPGEDVKKSYVQGLNYTTTLAARAAQSELGWTAQAGLSNDEIIFRLTDAEGAAVSGQLVIGELRRRATQDQDRQLIFRARPGGDYTVDAAGLGAGQWQLQIRVYDEITEAVQFTVHKTIMAP